MDNNIETNPAAVVNQTAIQVHEPTALPTVMPAAVPAAYDFAPKDLTEAMQLSDMLAKSTMVPKDFQGRPGNCFIAMQMGHELGLKPIQALQSIAVINGRPAVWGDALLALVIGSGACEYVREPTPTMEEGVCIVKRRGAGQLEVTRKFTAEDAQRAKLLEKDIWKQYRPRMLQMRARAFALRDVFPDVLKGMPIAEEVRDYSEPEKDVTSESTATPVVAASKSDKLAAQLKGPSIEEVEAAFDQAATPEAVKAGVEKAKKLRGEEDKKRANAAYHAAIKRLMPKPTTSDVPTMEEVRAKLAAATNVDEVDLAGSLIDGLPVADDIKAALTADYKVLRADFISKATPE